MPVGARQVTDNIEIVVKRKMGLFGPWQTAHTKQDPLGVRKKSPL